MANLRVLGLEVVSNTTIHITFTADLASELGTANVSVEASGSNESDPAVKSVSASGSTLIVTMRPLYPIKQYKITLQSSTDQPFAGASGERLVEDGRTNVLYFIGYEGDNEVRDAIMDSVSGGLYKTDGSLIRDSIRPGADALLRSRHDAGEVRSSRFITVTAEDESHERGSGPTDRLGNEGAFQLLRVGSSATGATSRKTIEFDQFPSDPVSLQQKEAVEEEVSNTSNESNSFTGLLITLANGPVIKLSSLTLVRGANEYEYDIEAYRYGLYNSGYDTDNAYSALDINENQVRLSSSAVGPGFPLPQGSDTIVATYLYKRTGRIVDSDTVVVTSVVPVTRDSVPAVATTFFLEHAPVVDSSGATATSGGVTWLDPSKNFDPMQKHPAFVSEVPFNESSLPSAPGEWAVEYGTGRVVVAGVNGTGTDGTTTVPPVSSYDYLKTFEEGLDYNLFPDLNEIASVSGRNLDQSEHASEISFEYEDTFANGTDFSFSSHVEVLNERIESRAIGEVGLKTLYGPVTNVFRIFNETTGEVYSVSRISGNQVYFSSSTPPALIGVSREAVQFESVSQAQIVVTDTINIIGQTFDVFKVELPNDRIVSATGDSIGASFNTSLSFSDQDVFARELYYDPGDSVSDNLLRLQQDGDYMVDYDGGIAYVAVPAFYGTDIGDASYKRAAAYAGHAHVTSVSNIYRSPSQTASNVKTFALGEIGDRTVEMPDLESAEEGSLQVMSSSGSLYIEPSYDPIIVRHIFQAANLRLSAEPVDFASGASIGSDGSVTLDADGVEVIEPGLEIKDGGARMFVEVKRLSTIASGSVQLAFLYNDASDALFLSKNYAVYDSTADYMAMGSDGYVDSASNRIVLPSGVGSGAAGMSVTARYRAKLVAGATVTANYTPGNIFIDYTYLRDEILVSYEYGDNSLDWSISDALSEGETYFVTYKYGAMRDSLRDNFGVLTGVDELSTIPSSVDRETYRNMTRGALQSFLKGPTIPAIKEIVSTVTGVDPEITESAFLEWILGRDHLSLKEMELSGSPEPPSYAPGKFGNGLLIDGDSQTAQIPATSNMRFAEGTWEAFVTTKWAGLENDAELTFDLLFDGLRVADRIFIGSSNLNPETVPFTIDRYDSTVLGKPTSLRTTNGFFIWFDADANKWRMRTRAPISESRLFTGTITTNGGFNDVAEAVSVDGYAGESGGGISEINDTLISTDSSVKFSFVVDGYDFANMTFDSYGSGDYAGYDGIDFLSDKVRYLFDTGPSTSKNRMSLYKDGKGFLKFLVRDANGRIKSLSYNIKDWEYGETHHVATSWKIGSFEQRDEMHLFVDGQEVPNTYRFRGSVPPPSGALFMDEAGEVLESSVPRPAMGGYDMKTTQGSNVVTLLSHDLVTEGAQVGDRVVILDDTDDGLATRTAPYVYVLSVDGEHALKLERGPAGSGVPYNAQSTLDDVQYSVNQLTLKTSADPQNEKVRVFSVRATDEVELFGPDTTYPDYSFERDGYEDYAVVNNGAPVGTSLVLRTYGLTQQGCRQLVYIWPNKQTNLMRTIMPQPTAVSKIFVTQLIAQSTNVESGIFAVVATVVGGHMIQLLVSNLNFCQPSNTTHGRRLTATINGDNFDFSGVNQLLINGTTYDGSGTETLSFTKTGSMTTSKYFTSISGVVASFTSTDITRPAGYVEMRETVPITESENGGDAALVRLSVEEQSGLNGTASAGQHTLYDGYARFGSSDIGKTIIVSSPPGAAGVYTISNVALDPSGAARDSSTVTLSGTGLPWSSSYTSMAWTMLNTSFADSGFANGLLTFEIENSGGSPYLLTRCWYEVEFPAFLVVPWDSTPETLFVGSDNSGNNQAGAVIDEMRILSEASDDTGNGETTPSSGRSITTDALAVREYSTTNQALGLFHFNNSAENEASFLSSFSQDVFQSENSVNSQFGQSAVFNRANGHLSLDNQGIFQNNAGTVEFWISPLMDTYNDPTRRYYVDLSPERVASATALSPLVVLLPFRVRSVSAVTISGSATNYFTGGSLSSDGLQIILGQPLPANTSTVLATVVPITSQGDRFSILKDENGILKLSVSASETDYQISAPVYWKRNTWHRVLAGWDLNNEDDQDRLVLMVDGSERGIIRYGTGLRYGEGHLYGMPTVFGSADAGSTASRNILADINLLDFFSTVNIGGDFTGQYPAVARMDNMRFSNSLRSIQYLGGDGPGKLIGQDLLYTSNTNTAFPVIEDALTTLLLDFDSDQSSVSTAEVRDDATGIFDFYVNIIDSFGRIPNTVAENIIETLIKRLKPAHTRAFVDFED